MKTSGKMKDLTPLSCCPISLCYLQTSQAFSSLLVWFNLKIYHLLCNHVCPLIPCPIMQGFVYKMLLRWSHCSDWMTSPPRDWEGESIKETENSMIAERGFISFVGIFFSHLETVTSLMVLWFCKISYHISMCRAASACYQVSWVIKTFQCCPMYMCTSTCWQQR